jgi:hypothetical protein
MVAMRFGGGIFGRERGHQDGGASGKTRMEKNTDFIFLSVSLPSVLKSIR